MVLGSPDSCPLLVETAALGLLDCGVTCLTSNHVLFSWADACLLLGDDSLLVSGISCSTKPGL